MPTEIMARKSFGDKLCIALILFFAGTISSLAAKENYAVQSIVRNWVKSHNEWDINRLRSLYGHEVLYYGHRLPVEQCLMDKSTYFRPNDAFRMNVISELTITVLPNEIIKCEFLKEVFYKGKSNTYPAYLLLSDRVNNLEIVGESDEVTDKKLGYKLDVTNLSQVNPNHSDPDSGQRSVTIVLLYILASILLLVLVFVIVRGSLKRN